MPAVCRAHALTARSSTSKTSYCFAEKKVAGPTGGPRPGGTTTRRFPPGRIERMPSSKPGMSPAMPIRVAAGSPLRYVESMSAPFSLYAE
jgi:hypothetical protein